MTAVMVDGDKTAVGTQRKPGRIERQKVWAGLHQQVPSFDFERSHGRQRRGLYRRDSEEPLQPDREEVAPDGNEVKIGTGKSTSLEAVRNGTDRKVGVMLDPTESLFGGVGDESAVNQQAGGRVMAWGDAKDFHGVEPSAGLAVLS